MAKNHYWKQFENQCARAFGGERRFPANDGGRLDFETPHAMGQCKTVTVGRKIVGIDRGKRVVSYGACRGSLTVRAVGRLAAEIYALAAARETLKWPVVCVKIRRGEGRRSEPIVCFARPAGIEWMGRKAKLERYDTAEHGQEIRKVVERIEGGIGEAFGLVVVDRAIDEFVVVGWRTFFRTYAF